MVGAGQTTQMAIWHIRIVCWITEAIDTPSKYVILNVFTRQQWLRERGSVLSLCIQCLVLF